MPNNFGKSALPAHVREIDLSAFGELSPRDLIHNPTVLKADNLAAGRALAYARSGDPTTYDAIGFRTFAALPKTGPAPLQTSAWTALEREISDRRKKISLIDEILNQQTYLRHRPLKPPSEGKFRYEIDRDLLNLYLQKADRSGRAAEERWTFSLTDLPEMLQGEAADRDEPLIGANQLLLKLEGTHWLPFSVLVEEGCFRKFQDVRSQLARQIPKGSYNCFVSHRWLDPKHPDPDASQARFIAWQLFAYLAEAVRVADQRGLHNPRRFSSLLGKAIGPRGTDLAEALIVNLLRFALDSDTLRQAAVEVLPLEAQLEDFGIAKATKDVGLKELKRTLSDRPILRNLADRIFVWYDYSCLPQPPRTGDDVALFVKGLEELVAVQIIGRTSIMLDDADDYLSRAWCTLEALVADKGGAMDLVVGSLRPSTAKGEVEHYFDMLLQDRPHVVWRAILDTEVFGIQSATQCMERLSLAVTDPKDLPFIYKRVSSLGAPNRIHIDDSEIVTGVVPLPTFENGTIAVRSSGFGRVPNQNQVTPFTLNWTEALSLEKAWGPARSSAALAPFRMITSNAPPDSAFCHVAIIGACEGEAIVLASWVDQQREEIESLFSVSVRSISWVATDIAPVGYFFLGTLEAVPVMADTWVVVAMATRLQHCQLTGFITQTLKWAGVSHATIAIDQPVNNVEIPEHAEPPKDVDIRDLLVVINLNETPPKTHPGGLFKWQIVENLI